VVGVLLAGLFASLGVAGLLGPGGARRAPGPGALPPDGPVGPVLEVVAGTVRASPGQPGVVGVALVDPGPDVAGGARAWAAAADVLARHGATATWFVSGRAVLARPADVTAALAAGGELGVTGFSDRDLAGLAPWRQRVELSTAQAALASRVGVTSPLLLLTESATPETVDGRAVASARVASAEGYALVVGSPPEAVGEGAVAVVPLDREAGARLEALLTRLDQADIRAATVSDVAGLDPATVNPRVPLESRLSAWVIVAAVTAAGWVASGIELLFRPLAALVVARAAVAVVLARRHARRPRPSGAWTGPVTVVVPAYNEAAGIETALRSILASRWRHGLSVIVVDDGSTDDTAAIVAALRLQGVSLVRQPNRGKAAALNSGIAVATTEVVVMVDGDTVFEPGTIAELVAPFADPRVGATSGNAKVLNRRSLLGRWQHIEYVMGFNLDRRLLATVGAITTVPGAVGAFRTAALRDVGGVSEDTLAEDTDLTIAVQRAGWRVAYQGAAVAWTEAPATVGDLWRQRYRWCYGTLQAVWKHRRAVVEPRAIGPVGLPYALTFQVTLALLGPIVDLAALYGLLTGNAGSVAVTWVGFTLAQVALATWAFRLDGESLRPLWAVPLQQVVYRQLMYLVVIQSVAAAGAGTRLRWHKLRRLGLAGAPVGTRPAPAFDHRPPAGAAAWPASGSYRSR
jgi:cellulose synthase/poly-beta-1,6-N-acetylglucosamine synthase-like glycosyltransferase